MRFLILASVLIPAALLNAQDLRPIKCRFLSIGGGAELASVITRSGKGEEISCPLPTNELSTTIVCYAKNNAIGFSLPDKIPAATAAIPAGVKSALLLFVAVPKPPDANAEESKPWRVFVIDDSPKNFPSGGAYLANLTDKELRFGIGEHKGQLKADGVQGFPIPKELDDFNMATLLFEVMQNDNWRTIHEASLRFLPGIRYLVIAHTDAASDRPRVKTIQDMAPTPTTPAKGKTKGAR